MMIRQLLKGVPPLLLTLLLVSCGDSLNVRQGSWLSYTRTYLENDVLKKQTVRVCVLSCEYGEGIGDEITLRVNYILENTGSLPLRVSWEDKYIEDQNGGLHEAFDGSNADDAQPGKALSGLYSRHRIPRSALRDGGIDHLKWGEALDGEPGLAYRVRLKAAVLP
ncbi:MAG: hypothetical protein PHI18_10810 [bacterium]|nr:hypothetical protein [bacterium]